MQNEADFDLPVVDHGCEKETYAFAGLAFYWASTVEHSALNLAVVLALADIGALTQEQFDEAFESLSRRTLGQLLNAAKAQLSISQETGAIIEDVVVAKWKNKQESEMLSNKILKLYVRKYPSLSNCT